MIHDKFIKHDAGAAANLKLMMLIQKEGLKGYGAYWILMEALRVQDDLSLSVDSIPVIARRFRVKPDFLHRIVHNYDLFVIEDEYFFSTGMINRMKDYLKRVHKRLPHHLFQTIQEDLQTERKEKEEEEYDGDYRECIYRLIGLTPWIEQMGYIVNSVSISVKISICSGQSLKLILYLLVKKNASTPSGMPNEDSIIGCRPGMEKDLSGNSARREGFLIPIATNFYSYNQASRSFELRSVWMH